VGSGTLGKGLQEHVDEFDARRVVAMEPTSWDGRVVLERRGVELVRNDLFLCHYDDFAGWPAGRKRLRWRTSTVGSGNDSACSSTTASVAPGPWVALEFRP